VIASTVNVHFELTAEQVLQLSRAFAAAANAIEAASASTDAQWQPTYLF